MKRISMKELLGMPIGTMFTMAAENSIICRKVSLRTYVKFTVLNTDGVVAEYDLPQRGSQTNSVRLLESEDYEGLVRAFGTFVAHAMVLEPEPVVEKTTAPPAQFEDKYIPPREFAAMLGITVYKLQQIERAAKKPKGFPDRYQLSPRTTRYNLQQVQKYVEMTKA